MIDCQLDHSGSHNCNTIVLKVNNNIQEDICYVWCQKIVNNSVAERYKVLSPSWKTIWTKTLKYSSPATPGPIKDTIEHVDIVDFGKYKQYPSGELVSTDALRITGWISVLPKGPGQEQYFTIRTDQNYGIIYQAGQGNLYRSCRIEMSTDYPRTMNIIFHTNGFYKMQLQIYKIEQYK